MLERKIYLEHTAVEEDRNRGFEKGYKDENVDFFSLNVLVVDPLEGR